MAVSSEKIALLTELADEFNASDAAEVGGRCVVRAAAQRGVGAGGDADPAGLAEPRGQRRAAGDLVAGGVGVGRHRQPGGRAGAGAGRHAVHAHPARHRHAPPDGRGARLAAGVDRLRRPRAAGQRPRRAGLRSAIPSGARSASARRTRTSRRAGSTSRSPSTTRRPARRRPDGRGPRPAGRRRVRHRRSSRRSSTTATSP